MRLKRSSRASRVTVLISLPGRAGPAESPRNVGRGRRSRDGPLAQPLRQPNVHAVVEVVEPLAGLALLSGKALVRRAGEFMSRPEPQRSEALGGPGAPPRSQGLGVSAHGWGIDLLITFKGLFFIRSLCSD